MIFYFLILLSYWDIGLVKAEFQVGLSPFFPPFCLRKLELNLVCCMWGLNLMFKLDYETESIMSKLSLD